MVCLLKDIFRFEVIKLNKFLLKLYGDGAGGVGVCLCMFYKNWFSHSSHLYMLGN